MKNRIYLFLSLLVCSSALADERFIAPNGSDTNSGTIEQPWLSITHAVSQVKPGGTIFIRGGIYRSNQVIDSGRGAVSGRDDAWITISNYRDEVPAFYGSGDFSRPEQWQKQGGNIWRTMPESIEGYDVGTVWHDDTASEMKTELAKLEADWDFWFDPSAKCVYVYAADNPADLARSIEIPIGKQWQHTIQLRNVHHYVIKGLTVKYTNTHGIAMGGIDHITIKNCSVSHGGGAWIWEKQPVRYGNAIELFGGGHDLLVEGCKISHYFDTGITNQGDSGQQYNITFRNNHIYHVKCGIEHWATLAMSVHDIFYENNLIEDSGDNWAGNLQNVWGAIRLMRLHPNGQAKDVPNTGKVERFYVRNNKILRCGSATGGMLELEPDFCEHPSIRMIGGPYIVEKNTIIDSRSYGIYASNGFSGIVRNNTISNAAWDAIYTENISDKAVIENNVTINCGDGNK